MYINSGVITKSIQFHTKSFVYIGYIGLLIRFGYFREDFVDARVFYFRLHNLFTTSGKYKLKNFLDISQQFLVLKSTNKRFKSG